MASQSYSPTQVNADGSSARNTPSRQQRADAPTTFVLGPSAPLGSNNLSQQSLRVTNGFETDAQKNHKIGLLNHLSIDLGNLLNRTDISDCYLNVKGTRRFNFLLRKYS